MKLEAWSGSNIGLVRKSNQDTVGCFPELRLFVVADGMGGRAEGEVASRMAVDTIHQAIAEAVARTAAPHPASPPAPLDRRQGGDGTGNPAAPELQAAVELANDRIFKAGQNQGPSQARGAMGTTVVALLCALEERRACWAHVGDSRLYRVRDGELTLLTADHTLFGEAFWGKPSAPSDLPHTNRLVRALGVEPGVTVAVRCDELRGGDLFLLCSDGVSGMVKPADLRQQLLRATALPATGEELIRRALDGGGRDNASALLVRVMDG